MLTTQLVTGSLQLLQLYTDIQSQTTKGIHKHKLGDKMLLIIIILYHIVTYFYITLLSFYRTVFISLKLPNKTENVLYSICNEYNT